MTHIETLYQHYQANPLISTDSRHISEGCIFFALSGERFDGNDYALQAIEQGAAWAVVDRDDLPHHPQLLHVEDTLLALQELAALHRATLAKPVIAITGTNGKTTTKELVAAVLSTTYRVLYTEGNLNNHIGVPLTLLRLKAEDDFAIIEMGASKPGDIEELCQIAQPNYGVITNIGEAHLEGFRSIVGVERTKAELYNWLREHEGKAIRREEDERLTRLSTGIPAVTYGQSAEAVIRGSLCEAKADMLLSFSWQAPAIGIAEQEQSTQLIGAYNLDNALAAIAIGLFFGVEVEHIREAIASYRPSNSRSQYQESEYNELIIDAYNANPSSMDVAIRNFLSLSPKYPKLAILGDMNELGVSSVEAHQAIWRLIEPAVAEGVLELWLCGAIWSDLLAETEGVKTFLSVEDLMSYLVEEPIRERSILIKGSNGIKLGSIVPLL